MMSGAPRPRPGRRARRGIGPWAQRPLGIAIVSILAATFGLFAIIAGFAAFGFGASVGQAAESLGTPFLVVAALIGLVGLLELLFAWGAWFGRPWAWRLGLGVEIASISLSVAWVLTGAKLELQVISILVAISIMHDLNGADVRMALGRGVHPHG